MAFWTKRRPTATKHRQRTAEQEIAAWRRYEAERAKRPSLDERRAAVVAENDAPWLRLGKSAIR